jgi:hypothetical protein
MADEVKILSIEFEDAIKQIQELTGALDNLKVEQKELAKETGTTSKEYIEVSAKIKVATTEIRANQKVVENSIKANKGNGETINSLKAQLSVLTAQYGKLTTEEAKNTEAGKNLQTRIKGISDNLKELEGAIGDNRRSVGGYTEGINASLNSIEGLRNRIKALKDESATLDLNSEEFRQATDEAAKLQLQVDQALGKVDEFGEREPKNPIKREFGDALITVGLFASGLQTLSAQFTDNEDAQAALAKSAQALAVATTVANIAKEKGAIIDTVNLAVTKAQTLAQFLAAKATGVLTAATRIFGITAGQAWAAATLGISVLIAGIVALIANFDKVTRAVKDFFGIAEDNSKKLAESYKRQNEELEQQEKILSRSSDAATRNIERRIKLEEAAGKDTSKLREQLFKQQQKFLKEELDIANQRIDLAARALNPEKAREYYALRLKLEQQLLDLANNYTADVTSGETKIREESAKTNKERLDNLDKFTEKYILNERQRLIKSFDDELKTIKGNSEKEKVLREAINKAKSDALIKFDNENLLKQKENAEKNAITLLQLESDSLDNRIKIFEEGFKKQERELIESGISQVDIERIKQKQLKELTENFNQEQLANQISLNDALLQNELAAVDNSVDSEKDKAKRKAEITLKYLEDQLELARQLALIDGVITAEELANIEKIKQAIIAAQKAVTTAQTEDKPLTLGELFGATSEKAKEIDESIQFGIESLGKAVSFINERYQREIEGINNVRDAEIAAVDQSALSEEEKTRKKQQINRIAAKKAYDLQVKQFNAEKALNITTAIINAAQAVLKASAQLGPIGAAIGAAIGIAQVGLIASQKPPAAPGFATGVVGLNGPGTSTSDSIPAYLSKGETVLPAWATEKIQSTMPGFLESHVGAPKFATGVVNFNPTPSIGDQFSILEALRTLPAPIVRVSDIDKGFNNAREVQALGSL